MAPDSRGHRLSSLPLEEGGDVVRGVCEGENEGNRAKS